MRKKYFYWEDPRKHWIQIGLFQLIFGLILIFITIVFLLFIKAFQVYIGSIGLSILALLLIVSSRGKFRKAIQDKNRIHKIFILPKEINLLYVKGFNKFNSSIEDILNENCLKFKKIGGESDQIENRIIVAYKLIDHDLELRIRNYGLLEYKDSIFISLGPLSNTNQKLINNLKDKKSRGEI